MADNEYGVHYPELPDAPNVPSDMKQLADDVSHFPPKYGSAGARTAALSGVAKIEGDMTYLSDVDRYERYNGSAWVPVLPVKAGGEVAVNSSAEGFYSFTHGMGAKPRYVNITQMLTNTASVDKIAKLLLIGWDASGISVAYYRTDTNAIFAGNPMKFHWNAEL